MNKPTTKPSSIHDYIERIQLMAENLSQFYSKKGSKFKIAETIYNIIIFYCLTDTFHHILSVIMWARPNPL